MPPPIVDGIGTGKGSARMGGRRKPGKLGAQKIQVPNFSDLESKAAENEKNNVVSLTSEEQQKQM